MNFIVTTEQNSPGLKMVSESQIKLDIERNTFDEENTVNFDDGFAIKSNISYAEGQLYIDGLPVEGFASDWINASSNLMCFSAAIHHKLDLNGASHGVSGSIQELNQICQNQLNIEELGEESIYALSLNPSDEGIRLELTVSGKNSKVVLSQLAQSA